MAFWQKKEDDFQEMFEMLEEDPGLSAREIARRMEISPSTVTRTLPSMEETGFLLSEDEKGGLWPFSGNK